MNVLSSSIGCLGFEDEDEDDEHEEHEEERVHRPNACGLTRRDSPIAPIIPEPWLKGWRLKPRIFGGRTAFPPRPFNTSAYKMLERGEPMLSNVRP